MMMKNKHQYAIMSLVVVNNMGVYKLLWLGLVSGRANESCQKLTLKFFRHELPEVTGKVACFIFTSIKRPTSRKTRAIDTLRFFFFLLLYSNLPTFVISMFRKKW